MEFLISMRRLLATIAFVALAFLWTRLGAFSFFPMGGAELHWLSSRRGGRTVEAAYEVTALYALFAVALLLIVSSKSARRGLAIAGGLVVLSAVRIGVNAVSIGAHLDREAVFTVLLLPLFVGPPMLLVAESLRRLAVSIPKALVAVIAALPGTVSIWQLDSSRAPPEFRTGVRQLLWLYPLTFLAVVAVLSLVARTARAQAESRP